MTVRECILAAFALAAAGRLDEAEAQLLANGECLRTEEGVDLLARIRLRRGDEATARQLWRHAVEAGFGGPRCQAALKALDSVEWRHRKAIRWVKTVCLAFCVWAIAFCSGVCVGLCRDMESTPMPEGQGQEARMGVHP